MTVTEAMADYVSALTLRDRLYATVEEKRMQMNETNTAHNRALDDYAKAKSTAEKAGLVLLAAIEASTAAQAGAV